MAACYKWVKLITILIVICLPGGCATFGAKLIKPRVTLVDVKPLNMDLSKQRLRFTLQIDNPNDFELPLRAVNFVAKFNDDDVASGKSHQSSVIPALGSGTLAIDVTAGIDQITNSLKDLWKQPVLKLSYQVSGGIQIANWNTSIPFDINGIVDITKN